MDDTTDEQDDAQDPVWVALLHTPRPGVTGSVFADPRFPLHVAFLRSLGERGWLIAAGPLGDAAGEGMTVVRVPASVGLEGARDAALADESIVQGLFDVRVRPWNVVMSGVGEG